MADDPQSESRMDNGEINKSEESHSRFHDNQVIPVNFKHCISLNVFFPHRYAYDMFSIVINSHLT